MESTEAPITTLPETQGDTICLAYRGVITLDAYVEKVDKPAIRILDQYPHYKLLIHFLPDYKGWTPEAADYNFKRMSERGPRARKLAYVNPPESKILQITLRRVMWNAEVRYFNDEDLAEALDWIKAA